MSIEPKGSRDHFIGMVATATAFGCTHPFVDNNLKALGTSLPIIEAEEEEILGAVEEDEEEATQRGPGVMGADGGARSEWTVGPIQAQVALANEDMFFDCEESSSTARRKTRMSSTCSLCSSRGRGNSSSRMRSWLKELAGGRCE